METNRPFEVLMVYSEYLVGVARVPSVLHRAGCRVSVMCIKGAPVSFSRFVSHLFPPAEGREEVIEQLRRHIESGEHHYDWIIIADDPLMRALARRRDEPWVAKCFPTRCTDGVPDVMTSKAAFADAATKAGLAFPASEQVTGVTEALAAAERIGYPVMLKPCYGGGGTGTARAANPEQLKAAAGSRNGPCIVQQFLTGPVGTVECLFDHGRLLWWQVSLKSVTHPGKFGPSCQRTFFDHPDAEPLMAGLGRLTGIHGFGGCDFILDSTTGRLIMIEIQSRTTPGLHMGPRAGWDPAPCIRAMLSGTPELAASTRKKRRRIVINMYPQDVKRCIAVGDKRGLLAWCLWPPRWRDCPWNDPRLFYEIHCKLLPGLFAYATGFLLKLPRRILGRKNEMRPAATPEKSEIGGA